jgi:ATP-binding cassette, subfamily B, bacterial
MTTVPELLRDGEDFEAPEELKGSFAVLRRGIRESPELRSGFFLTVVISLGVVIANLTTPVVIQLVLDHGFDGGFHPVYVMSLCAAAFGLVLLTFASSRAAERRLVRAAESAMMNLRVRGFSHIHGLSIAEQSAEKRGVFVARVTADVDAMQQFMEWGAIAWIWAGVQVVGSLALMLYFSWQLTLAIIALVIPLVLIVWSLQGRLSAAYDTARTRVGEMLSEVSESVMGAAVVRAYGLDESTFQRVRGAVDRRYRAEIVAHFRAATLFPLSTVFYALAVSVVIALGASFGPEWGLTFGTVTAFLFLSDQFLHVFTDLPEIYSETQTAIAGWRKVLALLDLPIEIEEPVPGVDLPSGALSVVADGVEYSYREGGPVLHGITLDVPAGQHVAIVGETGCGKTTFVKLISRLADPSSGRIRVGDVDLRDVAAGSRHRALRMVPQDGFLFDTTVRRNVLAGRVDASDRDVEMAFEELGLGGWVASLPKGLETPVGERGEALSVGERQLVALARAQIADPGLLILDEATSAVDPATERRISEALRRLSEGRTTITVAHRLSTAEGADRVFVFDAGRLVETGTHRELVEAEGTYARLYESWLGNVRVG